VGADTSTSPGAASATIRATVCTATRHPARFVPESVDDATLQQLRQKPMPPEPAPITKVLGLIPAEHRLRALVHYHAADGLAFDVGQLADARDEFVRRNPELFGPAPSAA
jgi:hypothetical protein